MLWSLSRMVEHNRLALLRLLAGLFIVAGLEPGRGVVEKLPRRARLSILKVLRQAESATRRLIVIEARGLEIPDYVPPPKRKASDKKKTRTEARAPRIPQFQLIDPRVFLEELYPNRRLRQAGAKRKDRSESHLLFRIAGVDGQPDYEEWSEAITPPSDDDLLSAEHICRRMQALYHALNDLPKQAQRLVRELAKRAAAEPGPGRVPPLRMGHPPGHRKKPIHEVDEILFDCHYLATHEPEPPDKV